VVEELVNGAVARTYTYGYERISQSQTLSGAWTPSFYIYDGLGTVRMMASLAGTVTDTYEYDAFGNMLAKTGATPNVYLYRGERYDPDLKLYYLRARWYNPVTGRFMTRDPYSGSAYDPASLHRYNYARSNPSNFLDPSGRATLGEYGLMFTNQVAKNVAVGAVGLSVNCMIRADAGILYLVGEFSHDNQTVIDAKADFTNCLASITVEQLTESALLSWGFGVVFDELGGMLSEALQGEMAVAETGFSGARQFTEGAEVATNRFGALSANEQATMLRTEAQEGIQLQGNPQRYQSPDAFWQVDSSTTADVDFMGHPNAFSYWGDQQENFLNQITTHAQENDFAVIDLTGASEEQTYQILEHIYSLPSVLQSGIILTGW
jgi:RHS repeat-associated protein